MAQNPKMSAQINPGKGLGFLSQYSPSESAYRPANRASTVLGASLHNVLTRLKAQPQTYPTLDLSYSSTESVQKPVVLSLPANGLRLRFDGPDQRLRLIEVLDFSRIQLTYKNKELVKSAQTSAQDVDPNPSPSGPNFRNVY